MSEDSLLERVTAAAEERQLSKNSLIAYRRTWLEIIAWAAAEGLVLETFPIGWGSSMRRDPRPKRLASPPAPTRSAARTSPRVTTVSRQHKTVWLALAKRATPRRFPR